MISFFRKKINLIISLALLWTGLVLSIGAWWLYLIFKMSHEINDAKYSALIKWEGGSFLLLLILLSFTLIGLYLRDQRKAREIQTFFASLTHELKTPLASIKLQAEVMEDFTKKNNFEQIPKLSKRLVADCQKLETQMDKILQLSRVEQGGKLYPSKVNIAPLLKNLCQSMNLELDKDSTIPKEEVMADNFALELVFKNLLENTIKHSSQNKIKINYKLRTSNLQLAYDDGGTFYGNPKKLGQLFYKYNSKKGSGIGLYLSTKLLANMNGLFEIILDKDHKLHFIITLPLAKELVYES